MENPQINININKQLFCLTSPLNVEQLESESLISIPNTFNWTEAVGDRDKAYKSIASIKVEEYESYIGSINFNSTHKDAFILAKGEYIVEVRLRISTVVDRIQFYTNQGRWYGPFGGTGGCFRRYKGQCLIGANCPTERWKIINRVTKDFIPIWYKDPLYKFIVKNKVEKINIVFADYINFLSFEFANGELKMGGEDIEHLSQLTGESIVDGCGSDDVFDFQEEEVQVLNGWSNQTNSSLTKDTFWTSFLFFNQPTQKDKKKIILELQKEEYVHGIQTRKNSQYLQTIIIHTNVRSYGPFGGNGHGGTIDTFLEGSNLQDISVTTVKVNEREFVQLVYYPKWEKNEKKNTS